MFDALEARGQDVLEDERVDEQQQQGIDERPEESENRTAISAPSVHGRPDSESARGSGAGAPGYGALTSSTSAVMLSGPPAAFAAATRRAQTCSSVRSLAPGSPEMRSSPTTREEAVGAEQVALAARRLDLGHVNFRILSAGQRPRHDVAPGMLSRRHGRHRAGTDLLLDPRMIVRDLLERGFAKDVDAAVADVRDADAVTSRTPAARMRSSPCRADLASRRSPTRCAGSRAGMRP